MPLAKACAVLDALGANTALEALSFSNDDVGSFKVGGARCCVYPWPC